MLDKFVDASVPKILTERVLIALLFIALSADDYLLAAHHGNAKWLSQAITEFNVKNVLYFIVVLALSWVYVLPFIKAAVTLIFIPIIEGRIVKEMRLGYVNDNMPAKQLLIKAIAEDNSSAYQHWGNHVKNLKKKQVTNEIYFYILVVSIINVCYENSFMRNLWSQYPCVALLLLLVIPFLGVKVGIIDGIYDDGCMTDVSVQKNEKDTSVVPKL